MVFADIVVNYWAVLLAGVINMILGFMWYGPLFGKQWMALSGISMKQIDSSKKQGMTKLYIIAFISSLIMAYILAHFVEIVAAVTIFDALVLAFWIWLGFVATIMLGIVLWEGKPVRLYLINSLYYLVSFALMAILLSLWQ